MKRFAANLLVRGVKALSNVLRTDLDRDILNMDSLIHECEMRLAKVDQIAKTFKN